MESLRTAKDRLHAADYVLSRKRMASGDDRVRDEGIPVSGGSVGGNLPCRVRFWPATGRASLLLRPVEAQGMGQQKYEAARRLGSTGGKDVSDVEFF